MTEQLIEKVVIDKFAAALAAANVDGIQTIGAWQPSAIAEDPKGIEKAFARGYLTVKAAPRAYDSYTIAEGSVSVRVELNIRAEIDAKGVDYLAITGALTSVLNAWQRSYSDGKTDFDIENDFTFTGFRLDGGDCGVDWVQKTWTWIQNLTVQGVFKN